MSEAAHLKETSNAEKKKKERKRLIAGNESSKAVELEIASLE